VDHIPLHPVLVHLPIALAVLMPLVMIGVIAAWWRAALPRRTWWVAVALQALLALSAVAALRSGEADEGRVERVVPEAAIEMHEQAAEIFLVGAALVLAITIAAGAVRGPRIARALAALATVGSLAVLWLGYRTGEAGGRLVYQHGAATAFAAPAAPGSVTAPDHDDHARHG
jgi:uncharacterized membrane protein